MPGVKCYLITYVHAWRSLLVENAMCTRDYGKQLFFLRALNCQHGGENSSVDL